MVCKRLRLALACLMISMATACQSQPRTVINLKHYPIDSLEGIITQSDVQVDKKISSDGNGSLQISATKPTVINLYETGDLDIEDAKLIYQAKLRTEDVEGKAFIEMWCQFAGEGEEYFSRALQSPLSGTQDWTQQETPFLLQKGQNPENVKINLVINGTGKVWIDDIHLVEASI